MLDRAAGTLKLLARTHRQRRFVDNLLCYLPYFSANPRFAFATANELLAGSGIEAPPVHDYLPRLLAFCNRRGWSGGSTRTAQTGAPASVVSVGRTLTEVTREWSLGAATSTSELRR